MIEYNKNVVLAIISTNNESPIIFLHYVRVKVFFNLQFIVLFIRSKAEYEPKYLLT